jgi:hypothetical protein
MFSRVVRPCLGEICVGILHEIRLSLLIAEAVGLSLERRIDGAIRFDFLVQGKALHMLSNSHVVKLAVRGGKCCRGNAKQ